MKKKFNRIVRTKYVFAGVCGGLGEYYFINPNILRVLFALAVLGYGFGIAMYILLWIILPSDGEYSVFY